MVEGQILPLNYQFQYTKCSMAPDQNYVQLSQQSEYHNVPKMEVMNSSGHQEGQKIPQEQSTAKRLSPDKGETGYLYTHVPANYCLTITIPKQKS